MDITVRTMMGEEWQFGYIFNDTTVYEIKLAVYAIKGMHPDNQVMVLVVEMVTLVVGGDGDIDGDCDIGGDFVDDGDDDVGEDDDGEDDNGEDISKFRAWSFVPILYS